MARSQSDWSWAQFPGSRAFAFPSPRNTQSARDVRDTCDAVVETLCSSGKFVLKEGHQSERQRRGPRSGYPSIRIGRRTSYLPVVSRLSRMSCGDQDKGKLLARIQCSRSWRAYEQREQRTKLPFHRFFVFFPEPLVSCQFPNILLSQRAHGQATGQQSGQIASANKDLCRIPTALQFMTF